MRSFIVESPPSVYEPWIPNTEDEFERQVLRIASHIMPSFKIAEWKPLVRDWEGHAARPDLAMVSQELDNWYVIEVELASHSISHIGPQLETLRKGVYDRSLVSSLKNSFPTENIDSLNRLVLRDPGLLCIVNQYTDPISRTCRGTGFDLVVLEPYFSTSGGWAVSVEQMPNELSRLTAQTGYTLRRGHQLGESVVMELPINFPASIYKIRIPADPSDHVERFVQVQKFERGPGVVLPVSLVPTHSTVGIRIVDPTRGFAELIVEN